jgi:hypothetical protein
MVSKAIATAVLATCLIVVRGPLVRAQAIERKSPAIVAQRPLVQDDRASSHDPSELAPVPSPALRCYIQLHG